jgi:hypothetical protein
MFADLDHSHSEVRADILKWGEWIGTELPISGIGEHQVVVVSVLITHIARPVFVLSQYLVYCMLLARIVPVSHSEVRADILKWGEWIGTELPISGMRIDAAKHYCVTNSFWKEAE